MTQVLCVDGPVPSASVGMALVHEHLFLDLCSLLGHTHNKDKRVPLVLEHLADIRQRSARCLENLRLDSVEHIVAELGRFGDLVPRLLLLDATAPIDQRNIAMLQRLSKAQVGSSGASVNVAFCTGPWHGHHEVLELADAMARELAVGCDGGSLRPIAIVLPIGRHGQSMETSSTIIEESQIHVWIDATFLVRHRIAAPVIIECGYNMEQTEAIVQRFYGTDPASASWVILSEVSPIPEHLDILIDWLAKGFHLCFDSFGHVEQPIVGHQLPNDETACHVVWQLCGRGFEHQLHLSTNLTRKIQLRRFGGNGLAHISEAIVPRLQALGASEDTLQRMVGGNALQLLAHYEPPREMEIFVPKLTCSVCRKKFPENSPEFFTKFSFVYCGSQCLREHRKSNFKPLPDPDSA